MKPAGLLLFMKHATLALGGLDALSWIPVGRENARFALAASNDSRRCVQLAEQRAAGVLRISLVILKGVCRANSSVSDKWMQSNWASDRVHVPDPWGVAS